MKNAFVSGRSVLIGSLLFLAACGGSETKQATGGASPAAGSKAITVKGSDTMVVLGQRFAEEYMKKNPGSTIQVNGGGSGTGFAALINGTVDLAQASRPVKDKERADIEKNGVTLNEVPVALDALAVFTAESNPVKELTLEQLAGIYTGKITNWKEIGGPDSRIVLYGRENSSGTYEYFKEHVLNKADFAPRVQTLAGTAAVINAVGKDPNGIGYGGIAYASGVKSIAIKKDAATAAVLPTEDAVKAGTYPISRKLYFYYTSNVRPEVDAFAKWAVSEEGQAVVHNVGYFPLADDPNATPAATDTATATAAPTATTGS